VDSFSFRVKKKGKEKKRIKIRKTFYYPAKTPAIERECS
jgi:hypothetical protein